MNANIQISAQPHQWSRRAWRKADKPSMTSRIETVSVAKRPNTGTKNTTPTFVVTLKPRRITMSHSTSDSSKNDKKTAHDKKRLSKMKVLSNVKKCKVKRNKRGTGTYGHEPGWEPRDAGRMQCWKCSSGSTLWCEWPGAASHLQSQTAKQFGLYLKYHE